MRTILILFLFFFTSCAFLSSNPRDNTYLYLNGQQPKGATSDMFKEELSKEASMAGGFYNVKLMPIVEPYLEVQSQEHASLRGLNPKQREKFLLEKKAELTENKLCFDFSYNALRFDKVSHLKNWKLFYISPQGETTPLTFREEDLKSTPVKGKTMKSGDNLDSFSGKGIACSPLIPKLSNGFAIKVLPDFVQFPFDSTTTVTWEFPEMIEKNGEKVWKEERKKNYKGYRGW